MQSGVQCAVTHMHPLGAPHPHQHRPQLPPSTTTTTTTTAPDSYSSCTNVVCCLSTAMAALQQKEVYARGGSTMWGGIHRAAGG